MEMKVKYRLFRYILSDVHQLDQTRVFIWFERIFCEAEQWRIILYTATWARFVWKQFVLEYCIC